MGHGHGKIRVDMGRVAAEDHDTVGEHDGFFDIVCDDEDGARGDFVPKPEFEKLAAQRLGSEHIERGKRLVHEKNFRLDNQSACDADTLLHAPGEFLRIRGFKTVEADSVNNAQSAFVALDGNHTARFERSFDIFEHGEPGKKCEALKNDGNVRRAVAHRRSVPKDGASACGGKSRQHAKQGGFSAAGSSEHGNDLPRIDGQVDRRDDLDAAAVRLGIKFLEFAGFDDWFRAGGLGRCDGWAHESVYYRSSPRQTHRTMRAVCFPVTMA